MRPSKAGAGKVQGFRGGLVFKAHRLCVPLNSRLESNNEEEKKVQGWREPGHVWRCGVSNVVQTLSELSTRASPTGISPPRTTSRSQFKNNFVTAMCSSSEAGSSEVPL